MSWVGEFVEAMAAEHERRGVDPREGARATLAAFRCALDLGVIEGFENEDGKVDVRVVDDPFPGISITRRCPREEW